jgi:hypothetical protein
VVMLIRSMLVERHDWMNWRCLEQWQLNNLGSMIPELFWEDVEGRRFNSAMEINYQQVARYLRAYHASPHGSELEKSWQNVEKLARGALEGSRICNAGCYARKLRQEASFLASPVQTKTGSYMPNKHAVLG